MTEGGVTTQYDQKIVLLIRRSNASPDAACVIWRYKLVDEYETHGASVNILELG